MKKLLGGEDERAEHSQDGIRHDRLAKGQSSLVALDFARVSRRRLEQGVGETIAFVSPYGASGKGTPDTPPPY